VDIVLSRAGLLYSSSYASRTSADVNEPRGNFFSISW